MEVSEAIAIAREKSEAFSRLARVLSRLKPLLYATGTVIRLRSQDEEVGFYCTTEADAMKLAAALPGKLDLAYSGASTTLYGSLEIQGVTYNFEVPTIRKIRLYECELKRTRKSASGWSHAKLLFCHLELAKLDYMDRATSKVLKERLWNRAIQQKQDKQRLERFDFVL